MKKIISLLLTAGLMIGCLAGCGSNSADSNDAADNSASGADAASEYSVAMITDYGDITDQ